jgi:hypothetical protein
MRSHKKEIIIPWSAVQIRPVLPFLIARRAGDQE